MLIILANIQGVFKMLAWIIELHINGVESGLVNSVKVNTLILVYTCLFKHNLPLPLNDIV